MENRFEQALADRCAKAFAEVAGAGCVVTDVDGVHLCEYGYGLKSCGLCAAMGRKREACTAAYRQSLTDAARFGGKYVYLCPMGLGLFATPVIALEDCVMGITVGPFLMVERDDYIACEVERMKPSRAGAAHIADALARVPEIEPSRVQPLSELLMLAASGISDMSAVKRLMDTREADNQQGEIGSFLAEIKQAGGPGSYPLNKERALLESIAEMKSAHTNRLLNELLGHVLFASGGDTARVRARVITLMVLMSRAAIEGGADPARILPMNDWYVCQLEQIEDIDRLCFWMSAALGKFVGSLFDAGSGEHLDVLPVAVRYIRQHYDRKLTLEEVASNAYLSPAHFSRLFKREMGKSFSEYLMQVRIEQSKRLLRGQEHSLTQIAGMVGFGDQSYFSKAFRRATGMTPIAYRRTKGRTE